MTCRWCPCQACRKCWSTGWSHCPECDRVDPAAASVTVLWMLQTCVLRLHSWLRRFRHVLNHETNGVPPPIPFVWHPRSTVLFSNGICERILFHYPDCVVPERFVPPPQVPMKMSELQMCDLRFPPELCFAIPDDPGRLEDDNGICMLAIPLNAIIDECDPRSKAQFQKTLIILFNLFVAGGIDKMRSISEVMRVKKSQLLRRKIRRRLTRFMEIRTFVRCSTMRRTGNQASAEDDSPSSTSTSSSSSESTSSESADEEDDDDDAEDKKAERSPAYGDDPEDEENDPGGALSKKV